MLVTSAVMSIVDNGFVGGVGGVGSDSTSLEISGQMRALREILLMLVLCTINTFSCVFKSTHLATNQRYTYAYNAVLSRNIL